MLPRTQAAIRVCREVDSEYLRILRHLEGQVAVLTETAVVAFEPEHIYKLHYTTSVDLIWALNKMRQRMAQPIPGEDKLNIYADFENDFRFRNPIREWIELLLISYDTYRFKEDYRKKHWDIRWMLLDINGRLEERGFFDASLSSILQFIHHFVLRFRADDQPIKDFCDNKTIEINAFARQYHTFRIAAARTKSPYRELMINIYTKIEEVHDLLPSHADNPIQYLHDTLNKAYEIDKNILNPESQHIIHNIVELARTDLKMPQADMIKHIQHFVHHPLVHGEPDILRFYLKVIEKMSTNPLVEDAYVNNATRNIIATNVIEYLEGEAFQKIGACLNTNGDTGKLNCLKPFFVEFRSNFDSVEHMLRQCSYTRMLAIISHFTEQLRMAVTIRCFQLFYNEIVRRHHNRNPPQRNPTIRS